MEIKFMYNGIKVNGKMHYCSYSYNMGHLPNQISIYARDYGCSLPRDIGLKVENDTDIMTDYFEHDSVHLYPGDKWYSEALTAWKQAETKLLNRVVAKIEKRIDNHTASRGDYMYLSEYTGRLDRLSAM